MQKHVQPRGIMGETPNESCPPSSLALKKLPWGENAKTSLSLVMIRYSAPSLVCYAQRAENISPSF